MELDDLKQPWKEATQHASSLNNNIMEIIQNKSYGPVAALKRRFRKQLVILPLVVILLAYTLSKHHAIFNDVLFWYYITICTAMCGYFIFSYRLLNNMQHMDSPVKSNLEKQVQLLEKGLQWRLIIVRLMFAFFMVLLEVLMYFQQEPSLIKWAARPLSLRLLCYAALLLAFYFFSKFIFHYKYGRHIQYLKKIILQMQ